MKFYTLFLILSILTASFNDSFAQKKEKIKPATVTVYQINERLNYDGMYYKSDSKNFMEDSHISVTGQSNQCIVLVNFHTNMNLNTTNTYIKDMRTVAWATPVFVAQYFFKLGNAHDNLALPKTWSNNQLRNMITFIFIPPSTELSFKIGYATPQHDLFDPRSGGSIQLRLKYIPLNAILVTVPIQYHKHTKLANKEKKQINFDLTYRNALQAFQKKTALSDQDITRIYENNYFYQEDSEVPQNTHDYIPWINAMLTKSFKAENLDLDGNPSH